MAETLLDIRGLKTWFKTDDGMVRAVDGVDLRIDRGETVGVVGESGCGKTVTARSVLKLIDMPPGRFEAGQILWQGRDLIPLSPEEMDKIRGVLSDEQQQKLADFREERRERARDRMAVAIANSRELNLSDDQKTRIDEIRKEYRPKIHEAGNKLREAVREELTMVLGVIRG